MTVSLVFLCALTAEYLNTTNTAGLNAAVFFIWFFILWWCFFVDATQYVYVSEIWPNHLRSQGTAWGLAFFYLASEITLVAAPVALNSIGWRFYLVLIVPSVCYIAAIWFLFPVSIAASMQSLIASTYYRIGDQRPDSGGNRVFVWRRAYREPLVWHQRRRKGRDREERPPNDKVWPHPATR